MKDTTLAQGNGILNLILQKAVPAEQLQSLIESGILSDILDANVAEIDRKKLRKFLGLKPIIRVYFDPNGQMNARPGCWRAYLLDKPSIYSTDTTPEKTIDGLMRTLKNFSQPSNRDDYTITIDKKEL